MDDDTSVANSSDIAALLEYVDFADAYQLVSANKEYFPPDIHEHIKSKTNKLAKATSVRNRVMHSRPLEYEDLPLVYDICNELTNEMPDIWGSVDKALRDISKDPSIVLGVSIEANKSEINEIQNNLPLPDFDETGFLGRKDDIATLKKTIRGAYPVVTIVGEGGIGKTSLALKVAYEIADDISSGYDAIVWVSCKTSKLTTSGTEEISNSITDTLSLIRTASQSLYDDGTEDYIAVLHDYMKEFSILLIIDNLETVLDKQLDEFLGNIPAGSKILITSRIGVGQYEYRVPLQQMSNQDALSLMRMLSVSRQVNVLTKFNNKQLKPYLNRMGNNPLFIKWFVSLVSVGKRPEEILADPSEFLDYAMDNVFQYLSSDSKVVLDSLLSVPGYKAYSEIAYLTQLDHLQLQKAMNEILRTNMLDINYKTIGSSYESLYQLSSLTRKYLEKRHPTEEDSYREYIKRKRALTTMRESISAEKQWNPYSFKSVTVRSRGDYVSAKYVLDAYQDIRAGKYDEAESRLADASKLTPDYSEVYRMEALLHVQKRNYSAAHTAYEKAIEADPEHMPLRVWYGGFLIRYEDDHDYAITHFEEAKKKDPKHPEVLRSLATAYVFKREYDKADSILSSIDHSLVDGDWLLRKLWGLHIDMFRRWAEEYASRNDAINAIKKYQVMKQTFERCPPRLVDDRTRDVINSAHLDLQRIILPHVQGQLQKNAISMLQWTSDILGVSMPKDNAQHDGTIKITFKDNGKDYGFIFSSGEDYFFHKNDVIPQSAWENLDKGVSVTFKIGANNQGQCARSIKLQ
ncbi:MAG: tetratricopeptide repeat protein [Planctomycetaceae bacterium]|nr:tetratricopeptide repeat protein [Planctomycetaceae bacterium]